MDLLSMRPFSSLVCMASMINLDQLVVLLDELMDHW